MSLIEEALRRVQDPLIARSPAAQPEAPPAGPKARKSKRKKVP